MLSFTLGKNSISIMIDGEFNTIPNSAGNFTALNEELKKPAEERDEEVIRSLITTKKMIETVTCGKVKITEDERVFYDGKEITNYLASRMLQIVNEGHNVAPFARFMERVSANPNPYTHDELYEWIEAANLPITEDGFLIAFKKVKKDYTDVHTGKFDNSVGAVLEMDRKACDGNRRNECSTGFHFCSAGYLSNFGGERVMVVQIDPADVTAIPTDYNRTKGRTCRYLVVGELTAQSDAYATAWNRGVVKFEDPAELPQVSFETKPKLRPMVIGNDRDLAKITGKKADVLELTEVVAPKQTLAQKIISSVTNKKPAAPAKAPVTPAPGALTFKTKDGRVFSAKEVQDTLDKNKGGLRPSARDLGIQDSTLRGWINKL